jgi:hypothetical protein
MTDGSDRGGGALRPLSVGETIGTAITLYRSNAASLWKIVALVIVPLEVVDAVVRRVTLPSDVFVFRGALYTFGSSRSAGAGGTVALALVALLGLLGQLLAHGGAFKLILDAYLGRASGWRESLAFAGERLSSLVWLAVLATVIVAAGFVLFVLPGIWLLVGFSVAVPALLLERAAGLNALRRSMELVRSRWWATFSRLLAALALYVAVLFVVALVVGALTRGLNVTNVTLWLIISAALRAAVVIFTTPFIAAVITVTYVDLRVRKEAVDIDTLTGELGSSGSVMHVTTPPET